MKNLNLFKTAGQQGYIVLPRRLLELFFHPGDEYQKYRVYVFLLLKATYGKSESGEGELNRGELFFTSRSLSDILLMNRRTLMRLLDKMVRCGLISIIPSDGPGKMSRIKMLHYDRLCTFSQPETELSKKAERDFEVFWEVYHQRSGLEPMDRDVALRYWKRLTAENRTLAMVNIDPYLHSVPGYKWGTAAEYLAYKRFLCE